MPAPDEPAPPSSAPPAAQDAPAARDLESVSSLWQAVVDLVRSENALLGALIAEAQPVAVDGEDLTLAFASTAQFLKKKAEDPANRATVGEALRTIAGGRWRLSYELREELSPQDRPQASEQTEEEWVRRFMEEFDAEEITDESSPDGARDIEVATSNEKGA